MRVVEQELRDLSIQHELLLQAFEKVTRVSPRCVQLSEQNAVCRAVDVNVFFPAGSAGA